MSRPRLGLTIIELLIVVGIIGLLVALLLPAVQKVREAAKRSACNSNLHQIGVAFHAYHQVYGSFPKDDDWNNQADLYPAQYPPYGADENRPNMTCFASILPFVEADDVHRIVTQSNPNTATLRAVPVFLCPSRRTANVGPKTDYGGPKSPFNWLGGNHRSILDTLGPGMTVLPAVTLKALTENDGTTHTMLLTHKGMKPSDYLKANGTYDQGYAWLGENWEHKRSPFSLRRDVEVAMDLAGPSMSDLLGSPHESSMGVLFGDGSVRQISYKIEQDPAGYLSSWNDGQDAPIPE